MTQKSIEEKYKWLDDIEHVLLRPGMYIGSTNFHSARSYLLDTDGKFYQYDITYNPGFIQLFEEIMSNAVDEHIRGSGLNKIKITVNKECITVWDNGGIPVVKHREHDMWVPELIFSKLKAGSNFDDSEKRLVAGTHGVGATVTNIFSKKFIVRTADGKKELYQEFTNNMKDVTEAKIKASDKNFTEITFYPELERFKMKEIDEISVDFLRKRVIDLAACNPKLKIEFNGESYKFNTYKDYCALYLKTGGLVYEQSANWKIAVGLSSDGFQHVSFANSIETKDGGTHVDYIFNQISNGLKELIKKKYKVDVKPSEIKNHMFLFINANITNSSFSSQTKDKLITEPKNFGSEHIVSDKFIKDIFDSEIIATVLDWLERKKLAEDKKNQRQLNKSLDKVKVLKLIDAKKTGQREDCTLGLFEGDSAASSFRKFRDPNLQGAFPLRGKFLNVSELTNSQIVKNEEVKNLMASIGLKLGEVPSNLRYGKIYIYTDADPDGDAIAAMLMNFFAKYWPKLFDQGRIFKVMTPLVVAKNGSNTVNFYTDDEYEEWEHKQKDLKKWKIEYKKGLASLEDFEYREIIQKPKTVMIQRDVSYADTLASWFAGDSSDRKEKILGYSIESKKALF